MNVAEELIKARENHYAVGAFNTSNLEVTKAICKAATEFSRPVIVQTSPSSIKYADLKQIFDIVKNEINITEIKAAIHVDHGKDFEVIRDAIEAGYRSVMIDGSKLNFEENVALTRKVVEFAKTKNVSVEGEIGVIGAEEGGAVSGTAVFSSPEQVAKFVELTGVDSIAVSVGNEHGAPAGEKIDLKLLEQIAGVVSIPLVMHGSSGLSDEELKEAIGLGVAKINVDTLIRRAFIDGMKNFDPEIKDYRDIFKVSMENVEQVVSDRIKLFSGE